MSLFFFSKISSGCWPFNVFCSYLMVPISRLVPDARQRRTLGFMRL
uniref:Uncharacterized protein n=1 Tax=Arundo donax TaxID=35708 RepID=A0A0A8Y0X2_ARUDO